MILPLMIQPALQRIDQILMLIVRYLILNSGSSYHMGPNWDWVITYGEINNGNVLMSNNIACKTVEIGTNKTKMYNGIIRTLIEVRHVPNLKNNLISLNDDLHL